MVTHLPSGSSPGQRRCAIVSFTTTTRSLPARSCGVKARPRSSRVPTVAKCSLVTALTHGPPPGSAGIESSPGTEMAIESPP